MGVSIDILTEKFLHEYIRTISNEEITGDLTSKNSKDNKIIVQFLHHVVVVEPLPQYRDTTEAGQQAIVRSLIRPFKNHLIQQVNKNNLIMIDHETINSKLMLIIKDISEVSKRHR